MKTTKLYTICSYQQEIKNILVKIQITFSQNRHHNFSHNMPKGSDNMPIGTKIFFIIIKIKKRYSKIKNYIQIKDILLLVKDIEDVLVNLSEMIFLEEVADFIKNKNFKIYLNNNISKKEDYIFDYIEKNYVIEFL